MCLGSRTARHRQQALRRARHSRRAIPAIEWAWENEPPALYGRFDLSWAGVRSGHAPKLLEYNADTPTSLLEAAVIQWSWLEEQSIPNADQFNSIHEKLIAKWKDIDPYLSKPIYFAGLDNAEDQLTLLPPRHRATGRSPDRSRCSWTRSAGTTDSRPSSILKRQHMFSIFKLYPWETMVQEEFGIARHRDLPEMRWIEPIWKMLLSNKGILPILWELYPNHELLLEAHFDGPTRPAQLRSQAHLLPRRSKHHHRPRRRHRRLTGGPYNGPQIYQALAPEAVFPTHRHLPVLGLWMIDQECCGLGIRESAGPITDNWSSFIPHLFV